VDPLQGLYTGHWLRRSGTRFVAGLFALHTFVPTMICGPVPGPHDTTYHYFLQLRTASTNTTLPDILYLPVIWCVFAFTPDLWLVDFWMFSTIAILDTAGYVGHSYWTHPTFATPPAFGTTRTDPGVLRSV